MKGRKKVIGLTLVIITLFTGTVFAATNGLFEGFPIVNIVVNNKVVKGDVPGINFNGRTMVPLRLVSEALGADISWDQETFTAYVTTNDDNGIDNNTTQQSIDELKLYNKIANQYYRLEALGEILFSVSYRTDSVYDRIYEFDGIDRLDELVNIFNEVPINMYNSNVRSVGELVIEAKEQGIDISDMNDILNHYYRSTDYYEASFDSLAKLHKSKNSTDVENYFDNDTLGYAEANEGISKSTDKYYYFTNKIQNY